MTEQAYVHVMLKRIEGEKKVLSTTQPRKDWESSTIRSGQETKNCTPHLIISHMKWKKTLQAKTYNWINMVHIK